VITAPIGRIAPARDTNTTGSTGSPGATGATGATANTAGDPLASAGGPMGETQFLQLLVSQMQNQDPTAPMDGTQMAAQLAQFSSVEQLINVNTKLDSITSLLTPPATTNSTTTPATQGS
jgi:flagellar basal-body rod modification protein FlgD